MSPAGSAARPRAEAVTAPMQGLSLGRYRRWPPASLISDVQVGFRVLSLLGEHQPVALRRAVNGRRRLDAYSALHRDGDSTMPNRSDRNHRVTKAIKSEAAALNRGPQSTHRIDGRDVSIQRSREHISCYRL